MKRILFPLLLLLGGFSGSAQARTDTLQSWVNGFYALSLEQFSDDGQWTAVRKIYDTNRDTLMVYGNQNSGAAVGYTVKQEEAHFLAGGYLLSRRDHEASLLNLHTGQTVRYPGIRKATVLGRSGGYLLLDDDQHLTPYRAGASMVHRAEHVTEFICDQKARLYMVRAVNGHWEVCRYGSPLTLLYRSDHELSSLLLSPSEKRLTVVEHINGGAAQRPVFINTTTGNADFPEGFSVGADEHLTIQESQNGEAYFIHAYQSVEPEANARTDIWYGNDRKQENKFMAHSAERFWLWNPFTKAIKEIAPAPFSTFTDLGSPRYFIAAKEAEPADYTGFLRDVEVSIYDAELGVTEPLGRVRAERGHLGGQGVFGSGVPVVRISANRDYLLYRKGAAEWELYSVSSHRRAGISVAGVPVFSSDSRQIFFEGKGLRSYDLQTGKLVLLYGTRAQTVEIGNVNKEIFRGGTVDFGSYTVDPDRKMLLRVYDAERCSTSYVLYAKKKWQTAVPPTSHYIRDFKYDQSLSHFVWLEEHYDMPTQVVYRKMSAKAHEVLFEGNLKDRVALRLRQDLISYPNREGKKLKGLLYYPVHFDPSKQYPMVVKIYQLQSGTFNHYTVPEYSSKGDGFDLRALLERGYFVYLPDIVNDSSGPGLSALDCINRALDAVALHGNIDMKRIGLVGHSHGGYETNFIATHSDRFAAYISGSGNSDLVRSYFSFNYAFLVPFYFQFENGQYEMCKPFSEDKALYLQNSPIQYVEHVQAPLFLWAGKKDENIAWDQVMEFFIGLQRNHKDVIAVFYPLRDHDLGMGNEECKDLFVRMLEWWDYFLKDRKDVLWINHQMKPFG